MNSLSLCVVCCFVYRSSNSETIYCGIEIKTPSATQLLRTKIYPKKGKHINCTFGDETFHEYVYKPEYRTETLHEATTANLDYILFVVADECRVVYSTLIHFPSNKRRVYLGILEGIYDRTLSWAYTLAWESNDPTTHIPKFRRQMVSSSSYPVGRDCLCFTFIMWKILREMVDYTQLPLPRARFIVPLIVSRWNVGKGRIDEMTRYLSEMNFIFRRASPQQMLIMRELKKMALSTHFVMKHCFPKKTPPKGQGYMSIQSSL